jgi:hypothetical protein
MRNKKLKNEIQNTKKIGMTKSAGIYLIALSLIYCLGCSKGEQAIDDLRYTFISLNAFTIDSMRLQVSDNDVQLTDSLITPIASKEMKVKYKESGRRYRVTDLYTKSLLLDTVVTYKSVAMNAITFFQPAAGGKLVWIGPPVNEPAPPSERIKLSIVYASQFTASTYDQIKVVVENSKSGSLGTDYVATDSFQLKRGEFSRFFIGGRDKKPRLKLYTTAANGAMLATLNSASFSTANNDFSTYYIDINSTTSATAYKLY